MSPLRSGVIARNREDTGAMDGMITTSAQTEAPSSLSNPTNFPLHRQVQYERGPGKAQAF